MPRLPSRFAAAIPTFAPLLLRRSWRHAEVLPTGAILAPGARTVASVLRIAGLAQERRFVNYHRVLNRAAWSPRAAARLLLGLLVASFVPAGPVVLGIDDTIGRRCGKRIAALRAAPPPAPSEHDGQSRAKGQESRVVGSGPPAPTILPPAVPGILFGIVGLILATPLAAAGMVRMVYVESVLENGDGRSAPKG